MARMWRKPPIGPTTTGGVAEVAQALGVYAPVARFGRPARTTAVMDLGDVLGIGA